MRFIHSCFHVHTNTTYDKKEDANDASREDDREDTMVGVDAVIDSSLSYADDDDDSDVSLSSMLLLFFSPLEDDERRKGGSTTNHDVGRRLRRPGRHRLGSSSIVQSPIPRLLIHVSGSSCKSISKETVNHSSSSPSPQAVAASKG
mmetsp:Transcript_9698/g.14296  ORF Transcript_9698/g.14296 Transcript_9698/m.14296 type:complete len:146 (-) Transcript_9698:1018-1455(-)